MKTLKRFHLLLLIIMGILFSCSTIPKGVTAVQNFDQQKYLGQWYEIARMDFRFERNLSNVTATYTLNRDGSIKVDNRGFDEKQKIWKQAVGKAKRTGPADRAMLKVSFFGPFYAGYNVIAIDPDYRYALVAGNSFDYLWILARETTIPEEIKKKYLDLATGLGFRTNELIWTSHTDVNK